jgi:membrane protein required for colicin V production
MDFSQLTWFDFCIIVLMSFSVLLGIKRGLLREVISLLSWVAAFTIAIVFSEDLALLYIKHYVGNEFLSLVISFLVLFLTTLTIGLIINYVVAGFIVSAGNIIWINHIFGAVFGFLRGIMITVFIMFLLMSTPMREQAWFQKAQTTMLLKTPISWMQQHIKMSVPSKKEQVDVKETGYLILHRIKAEMDSV